MSKPLRCLFYSHFILLRHQSITKGSALEKAHTWDLENSLVGKTALGCRNVYKIKTDWTGEIEQYKARFLIHGNNHEYGIDYEEIFAAVAQLTSVRSLLAIVASKN